MPPLAGLTRRADFLAAARARRAGMPGFLLQARPRAASASGDGAPSPDATTPADTARVGFTCSRKVGNAVARNRAKRRLRAIAREVLSEAARPGWDYVLIGRPGATATRPYPLLLADLRDALARVHAPRRPRTPAQAEHAG